MPFPEIGADQPTDMQTKLPLGSVPKYNRKKNKLNQTDMHHWLTLTAQKNIFCTGSTLAGNVSQP